MAYVGLRSILDRFQLAGMGTFTVRDVAKAMHKSTAYASMVLSTSKRVRRLERGVYYIPGTSPYELASNIVYPSYVSLVAALQYYELIDQNIIRYSVVTTKRHGSVRFEGGEIEFVTTSKERIFGYLFHYNFYIASPEKTFIDCLYFGSPDFPQVESSFASALDDKLLDIKRLKDHATRMRSKSLINKLGFLLELNGVPADDMLEHTYKGYVRINRDRDRNIKGVNRKWRILYDRRK